MKYIIIISLLSDKEKIFDLYPFIIFLVHIKGSVTFLNQMLNR